MKYSDQQRIQRIYDNAVKLYKYIEDNQVKKEDFYYNSYNKDGRLLSRHGQVEYLTTMKYICECLSGVPEPKILEAGAGTGRSIPSYFGYNSEDITGGQK